MVPLLVMLPVVGFLVTIDDELPAGPDGNLYIRVRGS